MVTSSLLRLSGRIPVIKFRKGSAPSFSGTTSSSEPAVTTSQPSTPPPKPLAIVRGVTLEDWQLPARFRRRPMSQEEIDAINNGGFA